MRKELTLSHFIDKKTEALNHPEVTQLSTPIDPPFSSRPALTSSLSLQVRSVSGSMYSGNADSLDHHL